MPKDSKKRIKPKQIPQSTKRVKPTTPIQDEKVCFNFKDLYRNHSKFRYDDKLPPYFCKLLERLKDLSTMTREELIGSRSKSIRFNSIDFRLPSVSEDGFGLSEDANDSAFEFSLSANEHGRVHGYFIANIFYIVWLDPEHRLCP